ncbi:Xanthine dehydrogenase/oxidase [Gossypium arboreum]|uniref:Xanthine dehydrogenase/oxidase n=1 Tax=Gossypium arboreum TaxID=29729 RepID=A0A0B0N5V3_GOSAR|nr:Xanthine dehydrogenase/oxidase [Gossypium arboreum]
MAHFCPHGQRHGCVSQPCVSPGIPYDFNSVLSMAKAHERVASRVTHQFRPQPRHTVMSCGRVIKSVCIPYFDMA